MSSYSSLLSASGGPFGVEKGCSESGEMCIPFEVHEIVCPPGRSDPPGRVDSSGRVDPIKCCCEGCILFEVVSFWRADATKFCSGLLTGGFTGALGEVVVPSGEGFEIKIPHQQLNNDRF